MRFARTLALGLMLGWASVAAAAPTEKEARTMLKVKLALLDHLGADALPVDVEMTGGGVRLTGTVTRRETMELAYTVARSVSGVEGVWNDLQVASTSKGSSKVGAAVGEAEAEVKDAVLSSKVRLALVDKMGGDGLKIGTEVASGAVTLELPSGLTAERRQQALDTAKGVAGVARVLSVDKR